jgi:hypothetical protein
MPGVDDEEARRIELEGFAMRVDELERQRNLMQDVARHIVGRSAEQQAEMSRTVAAQEIAMQRLAERAEAAARQEAMARREANEMAQMGGQMQMQMSEECQRLRHEVAAARSVAQREWELANEQRQLRESEMRDAQRAGELLVHEGRGVFQGMGAEHAALAQVLERERRQMIEECAMFRARDEHQSRALERVSEMMRQVEAAAAREHEKNARDANSWAEGREAMQERFAQMQEVFEQRAKLMHEGQRVTDDQFRMERERWEKTERTTQGTREASEGDC